MNYSISALKWCISVTLLGSTLAAAQEGPIRDAPIATEPIRQLTEAERAQEDVRNVLTAIYGADIDTVLAYTHPKIIAMLGGPDEAKSALKLVIAQVASSGMRVESLTFPDDPTFLKTNVHDFVIVPTLQVISAQGKRVESLNFQLGIREIGTEKWKYIEGSRVNKDNIRQLFPDFPENYEFPKFYRKLL